MPCKHSTTGPSAGPHVQTQRRSPLASMNTSSSDETFLEGPPARRWSFESFDRSDAAIESYQELLRRYPDSRYALGVRMQLTFLKGNAD